MANTLPCRLKKCKLGMQDCPDCPYNKEKKKTVFYKRVGRCQLKKCHSVCCSLAGISCIGTKDNNEFEKYYKAHGFKKIKLGKDVCFYPNNPCKHLKNGRCAIHKSRPLVCKVFPESKDLKFYKACKKLGCTYRFVKVEK